MAEFVMPSLGADMTAGTLAKWRVAPGDSVTQGDIIAEVDTDKGIIEVEVFETGTVEKLLVSEGEKVPVGTPLAEIGSPGLGVGPSEAGAGTGAGTGAGSGTGSGTGFGAESESGGGRILSAGSSEVDLDGPMASPAVRRKAHELDVSLERVPGSGDHGRITLDDVRAAATPSDRVRISPYARRIAAERGV
ncbi:MAG: E3 binding domain-containing protein, partial [Myxococcales bacterium]